MSDIDELYDEIPKRIIPYLASNFFLTPIVKPYMGTAVELEVQLFYGIKKNSIFALIFLVYNRWSFSFIAYQPS